VAERFDKRLLKLLPVDHWPTREEAAQARWFQPIRIGPIEARDRTWVPAMVPWRATDDGFVTENVLDWYRRFARGKPGVIVIEATGIRDVPSGPLLRAGHDRYLEGLSRLATTVHDASEGATKVFVQLIDFLAIKRRVERDKFLERFLVIDDRLRERLAMDDDAIRRHLVTLDDASLRALLSARDVESMTMGHRERVTDTQLPHVRDLPRTLPALFADAAARVKAAGFDGVELHYAHAYTMSSFLSRLNTRGDGYGGALEHRVRLPLEVFAAVRARVREGYVVGARFLGDDVVEGGSRIDDACFFAEAFARAGMDFLSISKGGRFEDAKQPKVGEAAYPYTGPSGQECMPTVHIDAPGPFSRNVPLAAAIRSRVRAAGFATPIVTSGAIATFDQAESILARGEADIVASARQSLADPDWLEKLRAGRGETIRRCLFTNYCEALDQAHKEVTCQRWDRDALETVPDAQRSKDGKRRLVAP
jgi:2,4-dienoyl-CoA reductase-like NADH-dependent reductase (Old Yellow Enzyme family)